MSMNRRKYYRVREDTFLWKKDAILERDALNEIYAPIEDIWCQNVYTVDAVISATVIEHNPRYFERVYEVEGIFCTKDIAKEFYGVVTN